MLRRLSGHVTLDFVNTIDPREGGEGVEYLKSFKDVVEWAARGRVIDKRAVREIRAEAEASPAAASAAFTRAIELREALYRIFSAVAAHQAPPPSALTILESSYREGVAHSTLATTRGRYHWQLTSTLDVVRWTIARAAVELLQSDVLDRVKRCPGSGDCGWLFLDATKNGRRRWCSMEGCGNRAKVRRFAARRKQASR